MKSKANYVVVFSVGSVFLLAVGAFVFSKSMVPADQTRRDVFEHAVLTGERLHVNALAEGEKIVIDRIKQRDADEPEGATYILLGGAEPMLVVIERGLDWKKDWGPVLTQQGASHAYPLTARHRQGLEAFFSYLNRSDAFWWQYPDTYEFTYFRNGQEIGSEKRLDVSSYLLKEPYDDAGATVQHLFSREEWETVISLPEVARDLEKQDGRLAETNSRADRVH